jgi:hypothetical protein
MGDAASASSGTGGPFQALLRWSYRTRQRTTLARQACAAGIPEHRTLAVLRDCRPKRDLPARGNPAYNDAGWVDAQLPRVLLYPTQRLPAHHRHNLTGSCQTRLSYGSLVRYPPCPSSLRACSSARGTLRVSRASIRRRRRTSKPGDCRWASSPSGLKTWRRIGEVFRRGR